MAVFRVITFLIHAMTQAMASLLVAVFTRMVPALLAVLVLLAVVVTVCTSCGIGGVAFWKRRRRDSETGS